MTAYRLLLRLYPASFRLEYGDQMEEIFAARRSDVAGILPATLLWIGTIFEVAWNAFRVHADLMRQDLRYTARTLARSPGFAATAILVSALGVGATTVTFSITDHVLIRPLPFPQSERLVKIWQDDSARGLSRNELSPGIYRDWKRMSSSFEAMAAYRPHSINILGEGDPRRLAVGVVSGSFFRTLARPARLGRVLESRDDVEGAPGTVVLSDRLWRNLFAADSAVLGRKVVLDDAPYEVVGVMPPDFHFPSRDTDLWIALRWPETAYEDRGDTYIHCVARLKRGVTLEQAQSQMRLIAAQLGREYPKVDGHSGAWVMSLRDEISNQARLLLKVLFGAAMGVVLIACTNLASLLLSRALARRKELAVRTAMGAGRERLVRQLLTESLVLAGIGGALGVVLAVAATPLVVRLVPTNLPISQAPPADLRMLVIAGLLTAATGLGFGVLPALRACRDADTSALQEGSRTGAGRRTERLRAILVVSEVTASVALLVASGLLIRALWKIQGTDPGFRSENVLTLRTALPLPKYEKTDKRVQLYDTVLSQVRRLPGVASCAYVTGLPMSVRGGIWPVTLEGQPEDANDGRDVSLRYLTPGFFSTLGVPLRAGRDVAETDTASSPFVAVVSESLAKFYWPAEDPLGKRFKVAFDMRTVVGVVGDIRVRGLERTSEPQVYLPATQVKDGNIIGYVPKDLVVRSTASRTLLRAIRSILAKADPQLPISDVQMLSDIVQADTASRAVQVRVLGGFAAAALFLAGIGIHGLLAFAVSQRTGEIGVRMALGAEPREILVMILRQGLGLALLGVALGTAIALGAGRAMQALLAGVSPADTTALGVAIGLSLAMTSIGCLIPATRASRLDPALLLRGRC